MNARADHAQLRWRVLALAKRPRGDPAHRPSGPGRRGDRAAGVPGWIRSRVRAQRRRTDLLPARSAHRAGGEAPAEQSAARRSCRNSMPPWRGFYQPDSLGTTLNGPEGAGDHRHAEGRLPLRLPAVDPRTTGMPLKTQLCDAHGQVIEQVVFASLTMPSPHRGRRIQTRGVDRRVSSGCAMTVPPRPWPPRRPALEHLELPPGFQLTAHTAPDDAGVAEPVIPSGVQRWVRHRIGVHRDVVFRNAPRPDQRRSDRKSVPHPPSRRYSRGHEVRPPWAKCRRRRCA